MDPQLSVPQDNAIKPMSERPNETSTHIDRASGAEMMRILRCVDAHLFAGFCTGPGLYDQDTLKRLDSLSEIAAQILQENASARVTGKRTIVFSGCGTSGRVAWLCARIFNRLLLSLQPGALPCFQYLLAGGDPSLVISNELPEDDPHLGARELMAVTAGYDSVLYFGISCGLSAPYVAGQLHYAMQQPNFTTCLIGFNPVQLARAVPIENWNLTFRDVALALDDLEKQMFACIAQQAESPPSQAMEADSTTFHIGQAIVMPYSTKWPFLKGLPGVIDKVAAELAEDGSRNYVVKVVQSSKLHHKYVSERELLAVPANASVSNGNGSVSSGNASASASNMSSPVSLPQASPAAQPPAARCFTLTPFIGPEAITGSSRMKGGSMTKILIDTIMLRAFAIVHGPALRITPVPFVHPPLRLSKTPTIPSSVSFLSLFEETYAAAYRPTQEIGRLIECAGRALQQPNGHLYYVSFGSAGVVGLMDQSEMVDTYGARLDEVRAFMIGGWIDADNRDGDLRGLGLPFQISHEDFVTTIVPTLTENDMVIGLDCGDDTGVRGPLLLALFEAVSRTPAWMGTVSVLSQDAGKPIFSSMWGLPLPRLVSHAVVYLKHHSINCTMPVFAEFAMKLLTNAITTGANIVKGAVYGNRMINLTVSNNKLFHRSVEIVSLIAKVDTPVATESLLRAIAQSDFPSEDFRRAPLSALIAVATPMTFIVPTAALLATGKYTYQTARAALSSGIRLCDLIHQATH
eukprot:m.180612 g.180612  ORF g.180612 m.180612 type:complete len:747 (-) comp17431_c1_seq1:1475-3715(-)